MMITALLIATLCAASPDTTKHAVGPARVVELQDTVKKRDEDMPDRWLGPDKFKHFGMSYGITVFGYGGARMFASRDASRSMALSAGIVAGLLKEAYDKHRGAPFSFRDLLWDAAGVAAGYALIHNTK